MYRYFEGGHMKKNIKIIKIAQTGKGINIPKAITELMGLELGGEVELNYDPKKQTIVIKKK